MHILPKTIGRSVTLTLSVAFLVLGTASCTSNPDNPAQIQEYSQIQEEEGSTQTSTSNVVIIQTNKGTVEIELDPENAPLTVENFLAYVDDGFYDGTIFHRVIPGFMIQGGGFDGDNKEKNTRAAVKNEADNGLKNELGTIAMARTNAVNSATSQFFINAKDNTFLNFTAPTPQGYGYTVFGRVTTGLDIVRTIEDTPTSNRGGAFTNAPTDPVVIESIKRK